MADETFECWLAGEIRSAENEDGMNRSYHRDRSVTLARLSALRDVRDKIEELWGTKVAQL